MAGDDEESVNSATIKSLENDDLVDVDEFVLEITHHENTIGVSRKAKRSMELAIDASANQPTYFYKCQYVVLAVCDITNEDLVEYSFRKNDNDSNVDFDWKSAFAGRPDTYPQSSEPSKEEFQLVKTVYQTVKEEKDEEAKKRGFPNSGTQSYTTFQQKWGSWRKWAAIYKAMYPDMDDKTVLALMTGKLKYLSSYKTIMDTISLDIKKHRASIIQKERLAAKGTETDTAIVDLTAQEAKQKDDLQKLEEKEAQLKQAKSQAHNVKTRSGRGRSNAVQKVLEDEKKVKKEKGQLKRNIKSLAKQKTVESNKKKCIEKKVHPDAPKKKKTSRNDLELVNASITPRQLFAFDGPEKKPPTLIQMVGALSFERPGEKWETASVEKAKLLVTLYKHLIEDGEVEATPTFSTVMETLGIDEMEHNYNFHDRAFIQLVALTISERFHVDDVILMLEALLGADLITLPKMAVATVETLATTLKGDTGSDYNFTDDLAKPLRAMAVAIQSSSGQIPTTLEGLMANQVDNSVARKLMQQVFGCTEIIVGLHTRTIACAVDLFDWEATEDVKLKSDIKMKQIAAQHVKLSLQTWLPRGQRREFQEAMDALGDVLQTNTKGFWGRLQTIISKKFKGKEKDKVLEMVNDISRFYKVVKCGKRKKYCF